MGFNSGFKGLISEHIMLKSFEIMNCKIFSKKKFYLLVIA